MDGGGPHSARRRDGRRPRRASPARGGPRGGHERSVARHEPDVVSPAEHLPFADASFDAVATRLAAHHFEGVAAAVAELARVSADRVLVVDNLFMSETAEEADRVRDPTHVRNYGEDEWRSFLTDAGLDVVDVRRFDKPIELEPWLERAGTPEHDAATVRRLLADRIDGGWIRLDRIALKAVKA